MESGYRSGIDGGFRLEILENTQHGNHEREERASRPFALSQSVPRLVAYREVAKNLCSATEDGGTGGGHTVRVWGAQWAHGVTIPEVE